MQAQVKKRWILKKFFKRCPNFCVDIHLMRIRFHLISHPIVVIPWRDIFNSKVKRSNFKMPKLDIVIKLKRSRLEIVHAKNNIGNWKNWWMGFQKFSFLILEFFIILFFAAIKRLLSIENDFIRTSFSNFKVLSGIERQI